MTTQIVQKAVIQRGDRYLIIHRSPTSKFFPNHWDFPGGKLEPGEDLALGTEREVREETGLQVKVGIIVFEYDMILGGRPHHFNVWSVEELPTDLTVTLSGEHQGWQWATKEQILQLEVEPYLIAYFTQ